MFGGRVVVRAPRWVAVVAVAALLVGVVATAPASASASAGVRPVAVASVAPAAGVPAPLSADATSPVAASSQGAGAVPVAAPQPAVLPSGSVVAPAVTKTAHAFDPATARVFSRAATSTDYANSDGTHTVVMSTTTVNYRDASGVWQPVDASLVPDPSQPGGFVSKANSWKAHFGSSAQGVTLETANGAVSVVAVGASLSVPTVLPSGDGVRYANAWPNVDLTYTVTGDVVKESVVIKATPAPTSFRFKVTSGTGPRC